MQVNLMNNLNKFEKLAEQPIFCSNKKDTLQSIGLSLNNSNQEIRAALSNNMEHFADMTRVAR